jgi:murein DD-endopeptidase MepM/ murein hydrolase activator NlpD
LSESAWDTYSGDNTRFGDVMWAGEVDQRNLTPDSIEQIYTDLSRAIFGTRQRMSAGYLYDQSYRNGIGTWHAGIDIAAPAGSSVRVPIGGRVAWTWYSETAGAFIGVTSSDGRQWVYGHLQGIGNWRAGMSISAGNSIGVIGNQSGARHLHLEVRTPPFQATGGGSTNQAFVRNITMSPLQAYWQLRNR